MQPCFEEYQLSSYTPLLRRPDTISPPEPGHEPMQVDSTWISSLERQRRLTQGLCLYCGAGGHVIAACPTRPPWPMVSVIKPLIIISRELHLRESLSSAQAPDYHHLPSTIGNWLNYYLLPEHGRTSPSRCGGPAMPERFPPVPQSRKMLLPSVLSAVPWLHHRPQWYPDGRGEGRGHQELACYNYHQRTSVVPGIF